MKRTCLYVLMAFMLFSCASTNRIKKINDPYNGIVGFKLDQSPKAYWADKTKTVVVAVYTYPVSTSYIYEEDGNNRPTVSADFQIQTPTGFGALDSVLYFNLDGEKIPLAAGDYNSNAASGVTAGKDGYKLRNLRFFVPENLWVSIGSSENIQYGIYWGKEGIDVKPNLKQIIRLKEFFKQAGTKRDANFPSIPEGQKKW